MKILLSILLLVVFTQQCLSQTPSPDFILESDTPESRFGIVSNAGDVNADGFDDIIVGAYGYSNGLNFEGAIYIYLGSSSGVENAPSALFESNNYDSWLGMSVSAAGDVNGDGYDDVIAGAFMYENGETNEGGAFVFLGSQDGIESSPDMILEGDQENANFGISVSGAGDINRDGYDDVIVGAWYFDNGQSNEGRVFIYYGSKTGLNKNVSDELENDLITSYFGSSVSCAGDVNGDGFDDVIIGAKTYTNDQAVEGAAYIYLGSSDGIIKTPASLLEGNNFNAFFGNSVSAAGDVNADGYDDVIVGAEYYSNEEFFEGAAYVYLGSSMGLNPVPAIILEGNEPTANFGSSVSGAGDVNADGYDDIIIGAPEFDNGKAYLFLGSVFGISTFPEMIIESEQTFSRLGYSVSAAGDINCDGNAEIIIGAPYYENGQTLEGAVLIYNGFGSSVEHNDLHNIYPNPASDFIIVDLLCDTESIVQIIDAIGQIIQSVNSSDNSLTFHLKDLPIGIYFIKIENKSLSTTQKFLKL